VTTPPYSRRLAVCLHGETRYSPSRPILPAASKEVFHDEPSLDLTVAQVVGVEGELLYGDTVISNVLFNVAAHRGAGSSDQCGRGGGGTGLGKISSIAAAEFAAVRVLERLLLIQTQGRSSPRFQIYATVFHSPFSFFQTVT
jgi:hypothetical protein